MKIKFIYVMLSVLISLTSTLVSCDKEDEPSSKDSIPSSLFDKTLTLYKGTSYSSLISIEHAMNSILEVKTDGVTVDYKKYPPKDNYYTISSSTAKYTLNVTKKEFIPYYGEYHYSNFRFDVTLTFNSGSSTMGTYVGTQYNGDGSTKSISGNFSIH